MAQRSFHLARSCRALLQTTPRWNVPRRTKKSFLSCGIEILKKRPRGAFAGFSCFSNIGHPECNCSDCRISEIKFSQFMLLSLILGTPLIISTVGQFLHGGGQSAATNKTRLHCFEYEDCESCLNGQDFMRNPCE